MGWFEMVQNEIDKGNRSDVADDNDDNRLLRILCQEFAKGILAQRPTFKARHQVTVKEKIKSGISEKKNKKNI